MYLIWGFPRGKTKCNVYRSVKSLVTINAQVHVMSTKLYIDLQYYILIFRKFNILDNMILKLERYANNLEEIVDQRTQELVEEKKKTDRLLYSMLPAYVISNACIFIRNFSD